MKMIHWQRLKCWNKTKRRTSNEIKSEREEKKRCTNKMREQMLSFAVEPAISLCSLVLIYCNQIVGAFTSLFFLIYVNEKIDSPKENISRFKLVRPSVHPSVYPSFMIWKSGNIYVFVQSLTIILTFTLDIANCILLPKKVCFARTLQSLRIRTWLSTRPCKLGVSNKQGQHL